MRAQSAARSIGNAARTERTPDIVPSVKVASQSLSSICSKNPSPGPMVWTRLFSRAHRCDTWSKPPAIDAGSVMSTLIRSEERRIGKECRSRWSRDDEKKKKKQGQQVDEEA